MINFENLDKFAFPGVGKYGIPQIEPIKIYPQGEFIPVNYHYAEKEPARKIVHFFVDDYQFIRHWNTPDKYIPKLLQFAAVCAPDFPHTQICRLQCRYTITIVNTGLRHAGSSTE